MRSIVLLSIAWMLLASYSPNSPEKSAVIGSWVLTSEANQINYPQITFNNDATAIFSSRGDTLYRFKFSVKGDQLYLKDPFGKEEHYRFKMPAKDKLIFPALREHRTEQIYIRKN